MLKDFFDFFGGDCVMRRSDREIRNIEEILDVIERCETCKIALNDEDGFPYIVPLNFGFTHLDGVTTFYFHGALEGKKINLIKRDGRAAFEMDCECTLVPRDSEGECTMAYESVMGRGIIEFVPDEEKVEALGVLMRHYHKGEFTINEAVAKRTCVFKLTVTAMSGKRNPVRR